MKSYGKIVIELLELFDNLYQKYIMTLKDIEQVKPNKDVPRK